jgi:hypothetical protein
VEPLGSENEHLLNVLQGFEVAVNEEDVITLDYRYEDRKELAS